MQLTLSHKHLNKHTHLCPEVHLHHIIVLQHCFVTSVRRPVCSHIIQAAAGGEGNSCVWYELMIKDIGRKTVCN